MDPSELYLDLLGTSTSDGGESASFRTVRIEDEERLEYSSLSETFPFPHRVAQEDIEMDGFAEVIPFPSIMSGDWAIARARLVVALARLHRGFRAIVDPGLEMGSVD